MNEQVQKTIEELNKFMTWWEAHYEIKTADDVRCNEIRPLYVEWKKLNATPEPTPEPAQATE